MSDETGENSKGDPLLKELRATHQVTAYAFLLRALVHTPELTDYQRHLALGTTWGNIDPHLHGTLADNVRILKTQCEVMLAVGALRHALDQDDQEEIDRAADAMHKGLHELEMLNPESQLQYSAAVAQFVETCRTEFPPEPPDEQGEWA